LLATLLGAMGSADARAFTALVDLLVDLLGDAALVLTVGDSMQKCAAALQEKNPTMRHQHFSHLSGLEATDGLHELLMAESGTELPQANIVRWRKRLQDAMIDSHFSIGLTRFLVVAEPDQLAGICQSLYEAGGRVTVAIATVDSPQLEKIRADMVLVGDLEDAETLADQYDLIVGNFHCEALAHRLHKGLVTRGFPNWEQVGNALKNDILYEGGAYFLFECANAAEVMRGHSAAS